MSKLGKDKLSKLNKIVNNLLKVEKKLKTLEADLNQLRYDLREEIELIEYLEEE